MNEQEPFSEVFNSYNNHLMNLMYTLAKVWLQSFFNFLIPHNTFKVLKKQTPDMRTYHLPDSGGSYLSRFNNDTSHILLTMTMDKIINYKSIYLAVILIDVMAYASHNISQRYHLKNK